ncbi:unnamed protein product [Prunus armeniaca]|uniref:Uncharacterized protein n=1 Tax=Prunus armeniaca TaxID=36596 RepID=A0A6J5WPB1_PRUAR|nr:unnamed protein product [Prunus armeniaca]
MEMKMEIVFGLVVSMFLQSVAAQKVHVASPPSSANSPPTTPSLAALAPSLPLTPLTSRDGPMFIIILGIH